MADATTKLSGYITTESQITWSTGVAQTLNNDGTGAAALADNEYTNLSNEYDNSTNKYAFVDVELNVASLTTTGTDAAIDLYVIPTVDGTNYPSWTGDVTANTQENEVWWVAGKSVKVVTTTALTVLFPRVPLYNGKQCFAIRNRANVAFANTGNSLYVRPHGFLADEA